MFSILLSDSAQVEQDNLFLIHWTHQVDVFVIVQSGLKSKKCNTSFIYNTKIREGGLQ